MNLPIPAYLLALVYFFLSLLSVVMLIGLRGKKTRMLLAWMLFFLLGVFPEAGMVLFMAVYYWVRPSSIIDALRGAGLISFPCRCREARCTASSS